MALPILINYHALLKWQHASFSPPPLPSFTPSPFTFSSSNNLIISTEMPVLFLPCVHKSISDTEEQLTEAERKKSSCNHKARATYHISPMSHEDGEVGQVTAGASGVTLVGFQQFTTLSGPVSHHAPLWVIPERTVGIVVVLLLQNTNREKQRMINHIWTSTAICMIVHKLYNRPCIFHISNCKSLYANIHEMQHVFVCLFWQLGSAFFMACCKTWVEKNLNREIKQDLNMMATSKHKMEHNRDRA